MTSYEFECDTGLTLGGPVSETDHLEACEFAFENTSKLIRCEQLRILKNKIKDCNFDFSHNHHLNIHFMAIDIMEKLQKYHNITLQFKEKQVELVMNDKQCVPTCDRNCVPRICIWREKGLCGEYEFSLCVPVCMTALVGS